MTVRCPICREPISWAGNRWRPFCSERCKQVDLGNWVTERYRVEGDEAVPEEDDPEDRS